MYGTGTELILNAAEGALQLVLTHDEELVCSILPVGDGLAVCTMK